MATPASADRTWHFGVYEVDTRAVQLRRGDIPVKLREQSFLLLVHLLEHAGEIVTREELRRVLWPSDTFVDFDHSLNTAVMKLRDVLGDSTGTPLYIETIPKRGYRFIAPVMQAEDGRNGLARSNSNSPSALASGDSAVSHAVHATREGPVRHRGFVPIAVVLGLAILVAVGTFLFVRTRFFPPRAHEGSAAQSNFQIVPLTTAPGYAVLPAISPDGTWVAYIWDGPERKHQDVYVQLVGTEKPLRLTYSKSGLLGPPTWSPDAREIAFSRCDGKNDGVYVVPALGGDERKLTNVACFHTVPRPLAWLSDGTRMLMIDRCTKDGSFGVVLFSLATGEKQCVARSGPPIDSATGLTFSLSPDCSTIAFTPANALQRFDIYTVPLSGGTPRRLTTDASALEDLMWTPDSKSIVFPSSRTTLPSLWRVSASGGPIERETTYPSIGSFSKDGRRFVYSEESSAEFPAIWRADLATEGGPVLRNRKLIGSQYPEMDAQPSPDGSRIVWMSFRTGDAEIWTSDATGGSPLQLTHLHSWSGTPRWSPDGKWAAFDSEVDGPARKGTHIFVVDSQGRNLHSITEGSDENVAPSWSRDGKSIYFASNRAGSWQLWKHSLEGGAELQLTKHGGFDAFESQDGQTIYFSKLDQAGLWSLPTSGGTESPVVADKPQVGFWGQWAVTKTGLYLLDSEAEPRPRIEFYDFATRRISPVLTLEKRPLRLQPSLSATADGRTIYYAQYDKQSVIKMMEIAH